VAIAFFSGTGFQSAEVLPQRVTHQGGTISLGLTCSLIGSVQELFVEDNLNCFHIVESIPHYTTHSQEPMDSPLPDAWQISWNPSSVDRWQKWQQQQKYCPQIKSDTVPVEMARTLGSEKRYLKYLDYLLVRVHAQRLFSVMSIAIVSLTSIHRRHEPWLCASRNGLWLRAMWLLRFLWRRSCWCRDAECVA